METPQTLVVGGRLIHNIYRTATLRRRRNDLVEGRQTDRFQIIPNDPFDGTGVIPDCNQTLADQNLGNDQWTTLQAWHAGLSCQLILRQNQGILLPVQDEDSLEEFNRTPRSQNLREGGVSFRILQCYMLPQGTHIPFGIGIERDGENHVCLYPTENNAPISNIEVDLSSFVIDILIQLQNSWLPYALIRTQANGFNWESIFPDSDLFPFRQWVSVVVENGEPEIAMSASSLTTEYLSARITIEVYLAKMLNIALLFSLDCDFDFLDMNYLMITCLRFALNMEIIKNRAISFTLNSTTIKDKEIEKQVLLESQNEILHGSRRELEIEGGRGSSAVAASIDIFFIDSKINKVGLILPFKIQVAGREILFDEVEPSPVIEFEESDDAKCVESVRSIPEPVDMTASSNENLTEIKIEASPMISFTVKINDNENDKLMHSCEQCFGYTLKKIRCKNFRQRLQGQKVWCYHHKVQAQEYEKFRLYGDRKEFCDWWI